MKKSFVEEDGSYSYEFSSLEIMQMIKDKYPELIKPDEKVIRCEPKTVYLDVMPKR